MSDPNYQTKIELMRLAKEVAKQAYAPYSNFPVGAAVMSNTGKIYTGCNVENASYGLTLCAERNAIASMITSGERHFKAIAIYAQKPTACYPCGACRQWLYEFGNSATVIIEDETEKIISTSVKSLIPFAFGPENLE